MRIALLLVLVVALVSVVALRGGLVARRGEQSATMLFDVIEALASQRPFTLEAVNRHAGTSLKETGSNDYFALFDSVGGAKAPIRAVELRLPRPASSSGDGLLILQIDPSAGITKDAILARFGSKPELNVPEPSAPYEVSFAYGQYRPGVDLKLQFARGTGFLVAAILDAIQSPPVASARKWLEVFPVYPGARELCWQHVHGKTAHIIWYAYVTTDSPEKVIAFYTQAEGKERAEREGSRVTFRHGDKLLSIHSAAAKDYPDCGKLPELKDQTVLIVSEATRPQ